MTQIFNFLPLPIELIRHISSYINIEEHNDLVFDANHKDKFLQSRIRSLKYFWEYNTETIVFSLFQECDNYKKKDLQRIYNKYQIHYVLKVGIRTSYLQN